MQLSEWEHRLEEQIPVWEREHDRETSDAVRATIWKLITAAEEVLLERERTRPRPARAGTESGTESLENLDYDVDAGSRNP
jgi:hypothetical protein